jgi:hypothetical protein
VANDQWIRIFESQDNRGDELLHMRDEKIQIRTAAEALNEEKNKIKLSTGYEDLNDLIGGIEEGAFNLFYGDQEILSDLVYRLLVNCIAPKENGGFEAKGLYFNNTNYYTGKTILNPSKISGLAKHIGVDPWLVFDRIMVAAAYNEERQIIVAEDIARILEDDLNVKLLVAHNLTRFFDDSKNLKETEESMKLVINRIRNNKSKSRIAFVVTSDVVSVNKSLVPRPVGGHFFRQMANVIVHFRKFYDGPVSSFKVTLVKHPYKKTPESILLYVPKGGIDLMNRIAPSFNQFYDELINSLKANYQNCLIDLSHREAFDIVLKEVWSMEKASMAQSSLPTVLDALNITTNVYNRKIIKTLAKKLNMRGQDIKRIHMRIKDLEVKREDRSKVIRDGK